MLHWLEHIFGLDNGSGTAYLFWSGICGDLFLVGGAWAIYRHHNCHVAGCPRIARHEVVGTPYKTCRKHHPVVDKGTTAADIKDARDAYHRDLH